RSLLALLQSLTQLVSQFDVRLLVESRSLGDGFELFLHLREDVIGSRLLLLLARASQSTLRKRNLFRLNDDGLTSEKIADFVDDICFAEDARHVLPKRFRLLDDIVQKREVDPDRIEVTKSLRDLLCALALHLGQGLACQLVARRSFEISEILRRRIDVGLPLRKDNIDLVEIHVRLRL